MYTTVLYSLCIYHSPQLMSPVTYSTQGNPSPTKKSKKFPELIMRRLGPLFLVLGYLPKSYGLPYTRAATNRIYLWVSADGSSRGGGWDKVCWSGSVIVYVWQWGYFSVCVHYNRPAVSPPLKLVISKKIRFTQTTCPVGLFNSLWLC